MKVLGLTWFCSVVQSACFPQPTFTSTISENIFFVLTISGLIAFCFYFSISSFSHILDPSSYSAALFETIYKNLKVSQCGWVKPSGLSVWQPMPQQSQQSWVQSQHPLTNLGDGRGGRHPLPLPIISCTTEPLGYTFILIPPHWLEMYVIYVQHDQHHVCIYEGSAKYELFRPKSLNIF